MAAILKNILSFYKSAIMLFRIVFAANIFLILAFRIVWSALPEAHSPAIPGMVLLTFFTLLGLPVLILNFVAFFYIGMANSAFRTKLDILLAKAALPFLPYIDIPLLITGILATIGIHSTLAYIIIGLLFIHK